jgi:urea transporter/murein DD-endopeptidase MepM/ murein hydrolase activator NlpD
MKRHLGFWSDALLNSYSQVFFARNRAFALFLLLVTFFDPLMGFAGLLSVLLANLIALVLGFDREAIRSGDYGFNSLLVGLGLGFYYAPNPGFYLLLLAGALLSFLFTVFVAGILFKYRLPYLSIPFLLALWALMLASRNFSNLEISERGVYTLNELYAAGSSYLVDIYQFLKQAGLPEVVRVYFDSLGAILFQFNVLSGVLIAIGLLIYSRIAFVYSLISYLAAWYFYRLLGADMSTLSYYYIGFNFILTGIALGGYFVVPSRASMLWTLILVPVLMILTSSLGSLFMLLQLGIYSLPFNIVVITFLYALKLRTKPAGPAEVPVQHHSPEQNLYHNLSGAGRFKNYRHIAISLPVLGEWSVSQAHEGAHTHRGDWKEAWDFVLPGPDGREFHSGGTLPEHFHCYGKPLVAPADGVVEQIVDGIPDNAVGDSNLTQNWGNSIVLRHADFLYSQISHIRPGSFRVKKGDPVQKGDLLAQCGNSGRSPSPHVHFQLQSTPSVGSRTLNYPLSHYVLRHNSSREHVFFGFPGQGDLLKSIELQPLLQKAFHFLPGQIMHFDLRESSLNRPESWEVRTDPFNNTYLACLNTGAEAWFVTDGTLFYFTQFKGSKKTLLYRFFLAAFRVMLGHESGLVLRDEIPLHLYTASPLRMLHDLTAPLQPWMRASFELSYPGQKPGIGDHEMVLESMTRLEGAGRPGAVRRFRIEIRDNRIRRLSGTSKNVKWEAIWTD